MTDGTLTLTSGSLSLHTDNVSAGPSSSAAPLQRTAISFNYRRSEQDCVRELIIEAELDPEIRKRAEAMALELILAARARPTSAFSVNALMQEFSLSSEEGIALMCLAEALLRIPDQVTADALIRDKLACYDWQEHVGNSSSLFVNAAAWGLMITGKLVSSYSESSLSAAIRRMLATGGRPLIRKSVDLGMQLLGRHFVAGRNIAEAMSNSRDTAKRGYRHSYDMLGEAALTEEDAVRYFCAYEQAIHSIGASSPQLDHVNGPGISIKLSALHPRYTHLQRERVMTEIYPRLHNLASLAREYRIGLTIDAEEADRVGMSLDLFEALALDPKFLSFAGLGLVVQAYGKRAMAIIEWLHRLARQRGTALMVRLVKGAYWDSEIKRAQIDGLEGFPVFTRKVYTDVAYIACAKRLLAAGSWLYPQFATHNALSVATIATLAAVAQLRDYEFQCLHGMGEVLYDQAMGQGRPVQACRIYAPVGRHETLLPYLVRRLLENGANSSFVNRLADERISASDLVADPICGAARLDGAAHPAIVPPVLLFSGCEAAVPKQMCRRNSMGLDISNDDELDRWKEAWGKWSLAQWEAKPLLGRPVQLSTAAARAVFSPADRADRVGSVFDAGNDTIEIALEMAAEAWPAWSSLGVEIRAACLRKAADLVEAHRYELFALAVREAGKTLLNAIAEVREAVDFLRYYADECQRYESARALGITVCISPWNFPLAIFLGQIGAALAAGNAVIAKPAEQTPLMGARAVELLHEAGIPAGVLQFLPGSGEEIGAALVADHRVVGIAFTGSTKVAHLIAQAQWAQTLCDSKERVLIAETGGQNAMVVDSSALPEQAVADAILSAFDSAGQRCSALRVLCVQEDIADKIVVLLKGAMDQLQLGNPAQLATDIGPVIDDAAKDAIETHVRKMQERGCAIYRKLSPRDRASGNYVAPTLIEISSLDQLAEEVFGPVLHVLRFRRKQLDTLAHTINAMGYGLTFGIHSRIDETIGSLSEKVRAGNIYVNRNMVGAVVGAQPFGGCGLSGTGPKAGGPLYLPRFLSAVAPSVGQLARNQSPKSTWVVNVLLRWFEQSGLTEIAPDIAQIFLAGLCGATATLPGPTGERNTLSFHARGFVLVDAENLKDVIYCVALALAAGNRVVLSQRVMGMLASRSLNLPEDLADVIVSEGVGYPSYDAVLYEGAVRDLLPHDIFGLRGELLPILRASDPMTPWRLVFEKCISVNTTASGGNTALLALID